MKKCTLFILFLLGAMSLLEAQISWFPTAGDEPEWRVHVSSYLPDKIETYTTGAEVDICGKTWTPILKTVGGETYFGQNYYRVDGPRVYYRFSDCSMPGAFYNGREYLMYDFSLEAGDSVYIGLTESYSVTADTFLFHVYSTDTICYGGTLRKVLEVGFLIQPPFSPGWMGYRTLWIEGIGDIIFPFPSMVCVGTVGYCEAFYNLHCLTVNGGDVVFSKFTDGSCEFPAPDLQRIYVDSSASQWGQPDGSDWDCAFRDLQSAIAKATSGDTIWVAQGTYYPTADNNREASFRLQSGVTILGGFAGYETSADQRDWENNPTVLSGDIRFKNDLSDNSYHVVYALGADSTAVLDGFTIAQGYAVHADPNYFGPNIYGGGLFADTNEEFPVCEPLIRNCRFIENTAEYGGGVHCNGLYGRYANPTLENCYFYRNRGEIRGGGVYKTGPVQDGAAQRYINCTFEENRAGQGGGAVCLFDACDDYRFENCVFLRDSTIDGGGAIYWLTDCINGGLYINNCDFEANRGTNGALTFFYSGLNENSDLFRFEFADSYFEGNSSNNGGGGALGIFSAVDTTITKITNCVFDSNIASGRGAGVLVEGFNRCNSVVEINSSVFKRNIATGSPGAGAIMLRNDVLSNYVNTTYATIANCLFYDNGGALGLSSGNLGVAEAALINCTLNNNGAFPISKNWSEDFVQDTFYCSMSVSNCILWEPAVSPYWLLFNQDLNTNHFYEYSITNSLANQPICNLPVSGELCGDGMLAGQNPRFVDPANGDFRVSACSPAIDAGSDADSQPYAHDLSGNPRMLGDHTDMGAFERAAFAAGIESSTPASCTDAADGAVAFSLNGDAPYNIAWQDATGQTGSGTSGLAPGEYRFFIEDRFGCKDTVTQIIGIRPPVSPQFTVVNASGPAAADGAILLDSLTGGTPPYTYAWSNGADTPSLTGIQPGEYSLTLTDAGDCAYELDFTVSFTNASNNPAENLTIDLFPNPVSAGQQPALRIAGFSGSELQGAVLDGAGRILQRLNLHFSGGDQATLPLEELPAGLYWVRVDLPGGWPLVRKLAVVGR
ncbi:MAG TPA: choice-of-anchor Q domain-containing protein [Flavilitoribacter sp.]|nr:choice-of-anchor Q domain-containing protein [Flavilitoribacter sp.]